MFAGVALLWLAPHVPGYAPRTDLVEFNLGRLAEERGDLSGAAAHYERTLAADPANFSATLDLGNLAARAGDYATARSRFERAVALAPDSDDAHANLGGALLALGDLAGRRARAHSGTGAQRGEPLRTAQSGDPPAARLGTYRSLNARMRSPPPPTAASAGTSRVPNPARGSRRAGRGGGRRAPGRARRLCPDGTPTRLVRSPGSWTRSKSPRSRRSRVQQELPVVEKERVLLGDALDGEEKRPAARAVAGIEDVAAPLEVAVRRELEEVDDRRHQVEHRDRLGDDAGRSPRQPESAAVRICSSRSVVPWVGTPCS